MILPNLIENLCDMISYKFEDKVMIDLAHLMTSYEPSAWSFLYLKTSYRITVIVQFD